MKQLFLPLFIVFLFVGCGKDGDPLRNDPSALKACIDLNGLEVRAQELVVFSSCSQNATSWIWQFGDGNTSTEENPSHMYTYAGTYTLTLTVSDGTQEEVITQTLVVGEAVIYYHEAQTITEDQFWEKGCHIVKGLISLDGAKLTIEAGSTVKFEYGDDKRIDVGINGARPATLIAEGTALQPILFTSVWPLNSGTPGFKWGGITIGPAAQEISSLSHVILEHGNMRSDYNRPKSSLDVLGGTVKLAHTTIRYAGTYGVYMAQDSYFTLCENNTFALDPARGWAIAIDIDQLHTIGTNNTYEAKGILLTNTPITTNATIRPGEAPYFTEHSFWIGSPEQNTLTIEAGTTLNFAGGGIIGGRLESGNMAKLVIRGTAALPVVLQGADGAPWAGIKLHADFSPDSYIDHARIIGATSTGTIDGVISVEGTTLNLTNSYLSSSKYYLIDLSKTASFGAYENNVFDQASGITFRIYGNHLHNFPTSHTFGTANNPQTGGIYVQEVNVNTSTYNISQDLTLKNAGAPYYFVGDLSVGNPANPTAVVTLTIEPGAELRFAERYGLVVGAEDALLFGYQGLAATLKMNGTADKPIKMGPRSGHASWDGIYFYTGTTAASSITHSILEGGKNENIRLNVKNGSAATSYPLITNSVIRGAGQYPIYVETNSKPSISNNVYEGNGQNSVFYQ